MLKNLPCTIYNIELTLQLSQYNYQIMNSPSSNYESLNERILLMFACGHAIPQIALNTSSSSFAYKCWKCGQEYSDICAATKVESLISPPEDIFNKCIDVKIQINCLTETAKIIKSKLLGLKVTLPLIERKLDSEFSKIQEELSNQYDKFKINYLKVKNKEVADMEKAFYKLNTAIRKRETTFNKIKGGLGAEITEKRKKRLFDFKFFEPISFFQYEINFEMHIKKLEDKIKEVFWKLEKKCFNDLDLDHLASEPYKKFKPNNYTPNSQSFIVSWNGSKLKALGNQ